MEIKRVNMKIAGNTEQRRLNYKYDRWLLIITLAICSMGLLLVSKSAEYSSYLYDNPNYIFSRHSLWLILGIFIMMILAFLDYQIWRRLALPVVIMSAMLCVAVLLVNDVRSGASTTLYQGSVKPSTLMIFSATIYLSLWISYRWQEVITDPATILLSAGVLLGVFGGLIYMQPDLSETAILFALGTVLLIIVGIDWKALLVLFLTTVVVGWMVILVSATGRARIDSFISGLKDQNNASYHVRASYTIIEKGGLFGSGEPVSWYTVPAPFTDSTFAVFVNQFGIVGGVVLISLYMLLVYRCYVLAKKATDPFGSLLGFMLGAKIAIEAGVHIMVFLGLIPFVGSSLPLISTGGSHMVVTFAGIGILLNISRPRDVISSGYLLDDTGTTKQSSIKNILRNLLP